MATMLMLWMALCAMVGLIGTASAQAPMMNDVDLPGRDYTAFWTNNVNQCQASCLGDGRCVAWTWVRPGIQGVDGRCWLKGSIPPQQYNTCCISAVERQAPLGMRTTFEEPRVDGHLVDHCQQWAQNCDGGGAQLYCQRAGYARAVAWARFNPGQTIVLGSGQICTGGFCVGYSRITCER